MNNLERVRFVLADVLHVDKREVSTDMTIAGDLAADSLDLYQIMLEIEKIYRIEISAGEFRGIRTVQDILHLIEDHGKSGT